MNKLSFASLDGRDKRLITKFTGAGIGAGVSGALMLALLGQLRDMKQDAAKDTSKDDDTLVVRVPSSVKQAGLGPGIAIAGGALGTIGGAMLTRKLIQELKRRDLQSQLDSAQQIWLSRLTPKPKQAPMPKEKAPKETAPKSEDPKPAQDDAGVKEAAAAGGKPMAFSEALLSSPVALALLLAAGSGTLAYSALDKQFSDKTKPRSPAPKHVRFAYETDGADGKPVEKEASLPTDLGFETAARMAFAAAPDGSDYHNIIGAITDGRLDELRHNIATVGVDAALDLVKGASAALADCPEPLVGLALSAATNDSMIGETVRLLAHAELVDAYPALMAKAAHFAAGDESGARESLVAATALFGAMARADSQAALEQGVDMSPARAETWRELLRHASL